MKLQELHEATKYNQAAKILKALSGVKGVKVDVKAADYDDVNGNPLPETYMVTLTYTPARGAKPVEHVKFYETKDGDWEYLSDTIGDVTDSLESTAASLRKEMEYAQKFHSDTDNGDLAESTLVEGYEAKVLDALKKLRSCYFENGFLWCDEAEYDAALEILKAGVARGDWKMPKLRIDVDVKDAIKPKVGDKR